jgi:hypothetical protein
MSFHGFDVRASDGEVRHYLFAHQAKEAAKELVDKGRVKWAVVLDCGSGFVIRSCGDPDATEELSCADSLRKFCTALADAPDVNERLKLLKVEDTEAGTCYVRFGSTPKISGSAKWKEDVDVVLRLGPGSLEEWTAGTASLQTICRKAQFSGHGSPIFREQVIPLP